MEQQLEFSHFTQEDSFETGNNIRNMRKLRGMTLEKLSEVTGIDPRVISRHENGQMCSAEALVKYAFAFRCSIEDLLPVWIACQIKGNTENDEREWRMLQMVPEEQQWLVHGMISALIPQTA